MAEKVAVDKIQRNKFHYLGLFTAAISYLMVVVIDFARWTGLELTYQNGLFAVTFVLVAGLAVFGWNQYRRAPWVSKPIYVAFSLMTVQVLTFGTKISSPYSSLEIIGVVASALIIFGLVVTSTMIAFRQRTDQAASLRFETPFAKLTLWTAGFVFLSVLTGVFEAGIGSVRMCVSWPLCGGLVIPEDTLGWLQFAHRSVVLLSAFFSLRLLARAWRTQRFQVDILLLATVSFLLFLAQILIGGLLVIRGFPGEMIGLHVIIANTMWASMVIMMVRVGLAGRTTAAERLDAYPVVQDGKRMRDFLTLTKPLIVLLLLVTTFAGMVVGGQSLPSWNVVIWTLLGGALAAGGSSAINQFIDRDLDRSMVRTSRRPVVTGRITPAEALAFGVALCMVSFTLFALFVNLLAAILALAGMVYYVLIYSILLKHKTVQNIVIGGGAGAIPPLVGWAAAAGNLTAPALLLFVIIFLWTPPHFWALALVRVKDYSRGKVPMLPVVRGEKETRRQIFIYTLVLVGFTLLAPVLGISGGIYLAAAILLGGWLIQRAWILWREGGKKTAWKMYRYSSLYLAFLFLAMVVDVLI